MVRFLILEHHVYPGAADATAGTGIDVQLELMVKPELPQLGPQKFGRNTQVDHGGQVHVAADPGKTVVIKYVHVLYVSCRYDREGGAPKARRLMRYGLIS